MEEGKSMKRVSSTRTLKRRQTVGGGRKKLSMKALRQRVEGIIKGIPDVTITDEELQNNDDTLFNVAKLIHTKVPSKTAVEWLHDIIFSALNPAPINHVMYPVKPVKEEHTELIRCELCSQLLLQHVVFTPCGHVFCGVCIEKIIVEIPQDADSFICPVKDCGAVVTFANSQRRVEMAVQRLPVFCPLDGLETEPDQEHFQNPEEFSCTLTPSEGDAELGVEPIRVTKTRLVPTDRERGPQPCKWKQQLKKATKHIETECPLHPITCKYADLGCEFNHKRYIVLDHEENTCPFRPVACPHCEEEMQYQEMIVHAPHCRARIVPCVHAGVGCDWTGPKSELAAHMADDCGFITVTCSRGEEGCEWTGFRKDFETHVNEECGYRPLPCKWCEEDVMAKDLEEHQDNCDHRHTVCPEQEHGCEWEGKHMDLQNHLDTDCAYHVILCCYGDRGCEHTDRRSAVLEHQHECEFRDATCQYCESIVQARELEEHEEMCESRPVECEFCHSTFNPRTIEEHVATCPARKQPCPVHGCTWEGPANVIDEHLKDPEFYSIHIFGMAQSGHFGHQEEGDTAVTCTGADGEDEQVSGLTEEDHGKLDEVFTFMNQRKGLSEEYTRFTLDIGELQLGVVSPMTLYYSLKNELGSCLECYRFEDFTEDTELTVTDPNGEITRLPVDARPGRIGVSTFTPQIPGRHVFNMKWIGRDFTVTRHAIDTFNPHRMHHSITTLASPTTAIRMQGRGAEKSYFGAMGRRELTEGTHTISFIIRHTGAARCMVGLCDNKVDLELPHKSGHAWLYATDGGKYFMKGTKYGYKYTTNAVISMTVNMDERTVSFAFNGEDQGEAFRDLPDTVYPCVVLGDAGDCIAFMK
eukprot:gnl/Dysnectes_brevis/415_a458_4250.p1 GENE.gnl/Dysnectes_brevis/415_a458_4250~~gnl/Dysnectes_brevis/415_a458_4250.p1  ORF type:complete len:866 (+),score=385.20 gnl/Dysnectes_brevis/415_a458_4250:51-2648(+)